MSRHRYRIIPISPWYLLPDQHNLVCTAVPTGLGLQMIVQTLAVFCSCYNRTDHLMKCLAIISGSCPATTVENQNCMLNFRNFEVV